MLIELQSVIHFLELVFHCFHLSEHFWNFEGDIFIICIVSLEFLRIIHIALLIIRPAFFYFHRLLLLHVFLLTRLLNLGCILTVFIRLFGRVNLILDAFVLCWNESRCLFLLSWRCNLWVFDITVQIAFFIWGKV